MKKCVYSLLYSIYIYYTYIYNIVKYSETYIIYIYIYMAMGPNQVPLVNIPKMNRIVFMGMFTYPFLVIIGIDPPQYRNNQFWFRVCPSHIKHSLNPNKVNKSLRGVKQLCWSSQKMIGIGTLLHFWWWTYVKMIIKHVFLRHSILDKPTCHWLLLLVRIESSAPLSINTSSRAWY